MSPSYLYTLKSYVCLGEPINKSESFHKRGIIYFLKTYFQNRTCMIACFRVCFLEEWLRLSPYLVLLRSLSLRQLKLGWEPFLGECAASGKRSGSPLPWKFDLGKSQMLLQLNYTRSLYCPATFNWALKTHISPGWTNTSSSLHPCAWDETKDELIEPCIPHSLLGIGKNQSLLLILFNSNHLYIFLYNYCRAVCIAAVCFYSGYLLSNNFENDFCVCPTASVV